MSLVSNINKGTLVVDKTIVLSLAEAFSPNKETNIIEVITNLAACQCRIRLYFDTSCSAIRPQCVGEDPR